MQTNIIWKKCLILLACLVSLTSFKPAAHPFFLSVTEINFKTQTNQTQVSCRIFLDDLQQALHHQTGKPVNLQVQDKTTLSLVEKYLEKHLKIELQNKPLSLNYLGYEVEEEAIWAYLESQPAQLTKNISIHNSILCEEHPEQTNIIHCIFNETRKSLKLVCPENRADFNF